MRGGGLVLVRVAKRYVRVPGGMGIAPERGQAPGPRIHPTLPPVPTGRGRQFRDIARFGCQSSSGQGRRCSWLGSTHGLCRWQVALDAGQRTAHENEREHDQKCTQDAKGQEHIFQLVYHQASHDGTYKER